jgi:hypothetical protein
VLHFASEFRVGSWKGASAHNMLNICKTRGINTEIICVDTWLGSNDTLWLDPNYRGALRLKNGYPSIFWQFVYNMIKTEMIDSVYPLPMTSTAAYYLLKRFEIQAELIYIDAGHEHDEVYTDLSLYYNLLRPGGVMVCDDYSAGWPGVVSAINQFVAEKKLPMTGFQAKSAFVKPVQGNCSKPRVPGCKIQLILRQGEPYPARPNSRGDDLKPSLRAFCRRSPQWSRR